MDLRLKSLGLTTQKSGTYNSKVRDLQLKSLGLTTQKPWTYGMKVP